MRTTLTIDDALLKRTKEAALRNNRTVSAEVEEALRTSLATSSRSTRPTKFKPFRTQSGRGVQPGVDLHSNQELAQLMDEA